MFSSDNFIQETEAFVYDNLKCLRFETSLNHCSICQSICPEDAFYFNASRMALSEKKCTSCSICIGSCPSEALFLKEFDELQFIKAYKTDKNTPLSCQTKEIPCLAVFNSRSFATMALNNHSLSCDITACDECPKNSGNKTLKIIKDEIEQANFFIQSLGVDCKITKENNYSPLEKRSLLKRAAKKLIPKEKKETKKESLRNRFLFESLLDLDIQQREIPTSIVFNKTVDNSCNLCNECQDFCPTGALDIVNNEKHRELFFTPHKCIDCGNCEIICKAKAMGKKNTINTKDLISSKESLLISKEKSICKECKCTFVQTNSKDLCSRCIQIEDLPKELFSLARDLD